MYKIHKLKLFHTQEIEKLHKAIANLLQLQRKQDARIKLSEQSKSKLQTSRSIIDKKIVDLQSELITTLVDNNLID